MYTDELIFDTTLGAFYKNDIKELASDSPFVADYVLSKTYTNVTTAENVTNNSGVDVEDSTPEQIVTNVVATDRDKIRLKYVAFQNPDLTISFYRDTDFLDWVSSDLTGADANAYMLTGYEILDDASKQQQAPYIIVHLRRTEETYQDVGGTPVPDNQSSCKMQAQWGFADSSTSNKFGPEQQVYKLLRNYTPVAEPDYDYGFDVITTRNKVRGRGRALSLLFKTDPGKDLKLLGWDTTHTEVENV